MTFLRNSVQVIESKGGGRSPFVRSVSGIHDRLEEPCPIGEKPSVTLGAPWFATGILDSAEAGNVRLIQWLVLPSVIGVMLIYFRGLLSAFLEIGRLHQAPREGQLLRAELPTGANQERDRHDEEFPPT